MKRELILITILIGALSICTASANAQAPAQRSNTIVFVDGKDFYLHTVSQGETLYGIGRLYNVAPERIRQDNPGLDDSLKEGQILKILCSDIPENKMSARKQARTFSEHTVAAGDTTYSIAKRYGISVDTIIEDNPGLDPAVLSVGTTLMIRKSEIGAADDSAITSAIDRYADALNEISDDYLFYVVRQGDTLYSLSRAFNVPQDTLESINNLADGLKAGSILKIPYTSDGREVIAAIASGGQPPIVDEYPDTQQGGNFTDAGGYLESHYAGLHDFEYRGNMNIAVLLPFSDANDASSRNFVDFYRGVLLAFEDLKSAGYSMTVNVFNTQRDIGSLSEIVQSREFRSSDLVIGPVYESGLETAMNAAREMRIPLVSPLAVIEGNYGNSLYQMAPDPAHKYDKLKKLFTHDKNIIFVTSASTDDEFAKDMAALAEGYEVNRVSFTANRDQALANFRRALSTSKTNMFVVLSDDSVEIDKILATLSSINTNYQARSQKMAPIEVIGSAKWARYNNIDRELYFKLNVTYVTNYAVHRSNIKVNQFDRRFLTEYSNLPSPYAYRGYDAVILFVEGMIQESEATLNDKLDDMAPPLQAGYRFETKDNGNNVNIDWPLVRYKDDFTVEIK